jgi:hypothetical protein
MKAKAALEQFADHSGGANGNVSNQLKVLRTTLGNLQ